MENVDGAMCVSRRRYRQSQYWPFSLWTACYWPCARWSLYFVTVTLTTLASFSILGTFSLSLSLSLFAHSINHAQDEARVPLCTKKDSYNSIAYVLRSFTFQQTTNQRWPNTIRMRKRIGIGEETGDTRSLLRIREENFWVSVCANVRLILWYAQALSVGFFFSSLATVHHWLWCGASRWFTGFRHVHTRLRIFELRISEATECWLYVNVFDLSASARPSGPSVGRTEAIAFFRKQWTSRVANAAERPSIVWSLSLHLYLLRWFS